MNARNLRNVLLLGVAFAGTSAAMPAFAQDEQALNPADIIVTARRTEERLQDVPISITVYTGDQIQKRNVAIASDLAVYTPSLSVNTRFGPEKATFAIRGFNQDAAAAPTVGVYFADVVGVRAQGGTASGNNVGAGTFTDLQNVQVLKGPQGTLQGRNTTGGAIMLVPAKPTDNLEGNIEGTYGNYKQKRIQAAVNIPLAETFKVRVSVDRNDREGYMKNHSGIGPDAYNDVNYFYGRLSIVADLTPELENYTIFHYSRSDTNGYASHYEGCDSAATAAQGIRYLTSMAACAQIGRQAARGDGPLDVEVGNDDPRVYLRTWQAINTTTWQATDNLTVKNIVSYGEYREQAAFQLYSDNFFFPGTTNRFDYIQLDTQPGYDAAAESTMTEELQLQGRSSDGKFNFVVGGYLEWSRPIGWNQQRTGVYGNCADPGTLSCVGGLPLIPLPANALFPGSPAMTLNGAIVSESRTQMDFDNHGLFGQGTYKFTDQLSLTVGGRWTFDKIDGVAESNRYVFGTLPAALGGSTRLFSRVCNDSLNHPTVNLLTNGGDTAACRSRIVAKTNKPTWLIDIDYKPTPDTLVYAKYARGYRQGAVNFTNPGLETVGPEKVDSYELGAKLTFRGAVPGYFNVAGFYNNFQDQQIFGALIAKPGSGLAGGAALINAGKSVIKGIEIDAGVTLMNALRLSVGYTYLDTKLKELVAPTLAADSPFAQIIPRGELNGPLTYAPKHKLSASADYTLSLGAVGDLNLGAIWSYTASQLVDGNNKIPSYSLINLNGTFANVGGTGVDLTVFASNVGNKHYRTTSGGGYESSGIRDFMYGAPRMYGLRLKFSFGQ